MALFKWECLEGIINNGHYVMLEAGVMHAPAYKVSIQRHNNLQIHLTTKCHGDAQTDYTERPLGTVRNNGDNTKLVSTLSKNEIILKGIGSINSNESYNSQTGRVITETAEIHSVEGNFKPADSGEYLFEWIQNVDVDYYHWPHLVKYNREEKLSLTFDKDNSDLSFSTINEETFSGRMSVHLVIGGYELWLSKVDNAKSQKEDGCGFILYKGCPSEEERRKIRDCISFALGRPLVYLGNTILDHEYSLVSFYAISAYSYDGKANDLSTSPPIFLGETYVHELNEVKFHRLIYGLYRIYDAYNLGELFWMYWHAICAPSHSAPVQFGASIEALRRSLLEGNKAGIQTAILEKPDWKIFMEQSSAMLEGLNIDRAGKDIIKNKIGSLNQAPQSIVTERLYEFLNLEFTSVERVAWERRNHSAHGKSIEAGEHINLIRDIKVLKVLFHRLLIKVSEGSDDYIDYFSLNHPIRKIEVGIPPEAS